jgi:hypothetical protein
MNEDEHARLLALVGDVWDLWLVFLVALVACALYVWFALSGVGVWRLSPLLGYVAVAQWYLLTQGKAKKPRI